MVKNKGSKKVTIGLVFSWIFSIIFFLAAFGSIIDGSYISTLVLLILILVLFPPLTKIYKKKMNFELSKGIKILLVIAGLFILGVVESADTPDTQETEYAPPPQNVQNIQSEPEKPIQEDTPEIIKNEKGETVIEITATELYSEYSANEIRADELYKNKILWVDGKINSIGKDLFDSMYLTLETENLIGGVQCMLKSSEKQKAMSLEEGDYVIVQGKNKGESVMNIILRECVILAGDHEI